MRQVRLLFPLLGLGMMLIGLVFKFQAAEEGLSVTPVHTLQNSNARAAFLDPSSRFLYLLEDPDTWNIKIVDWRENEVVKVLDFSHFPCSVRGKPVPGNVRRIVFHPRSNSAFLSFCNTVYLVDSSALRVGSALSNQETDYGAQFTQSDDGRWFALVRADIRSKSEFTITLHSASDLRVMNTWKVPSNRFAFASANNQLAFLWSGDPERNRVSDEACAVSIYEVPSGNLLKTTRLHLNGRSCPLRPFQFLPGKQGALVGNDDHSGSIAVWDVHSGKLILEIKDDKPIENIALAWDGKLVFGSVWIKEAKRQQEFKIWDASTGAPLYELKEKNEVLGEENRRYFTPSGAFSSDGRFLVVTTSSGVTIYELDRNAAPSEEQEPAKAGHDVRRGKLLPYPLPNHLDSLSWWCRLMGGI